MNWFRMHHDARNDAKLRSLTDAQFRVWFNLLCFASEQEERGTVEIDDEELLALEIAEGNPDLLRDTLTRLEKLRVISRDDANLCFRQWDKRQYDNPSDAPEATRLRKQAQRDREKQARELAKSAASVPRHDMSRPVTTPVTTTDQTRPDQTRADSEQTRPPPSPSQGAALVGGGGSLHAIFLDAGYSMAEIHRMEREYAENPPKSKVKNACSYKLAVLKRLRDEFGVPSESNPVASPKPKPAKTPEQIAEEEAERKSRLAEADAAVEKSKHIRALRAQEGQNHAKNMGEIPVGVP